MGQRGPAPQPTALKLLRGNPGKWALNPSEPKPEASVPPCPDWLSDEAKAKWEELRPELEACGLLTKVDGDALARYCWAWAEWRKVAEWLQSNPWIYPLRDDQGRLKYLMQVPQVSMAKSLDAIGRQWAGRLGLTPADRTGIRIDPHRNAAESPLAKIRAQARRLHESPITVRLPYGLDGC